MPPRPRFQDDPTLFAEYQIAETLHMTVADVRERLSTHDVIEWTAYWRYKAALQDQAIERAQMERDA